MAGVDLGRVAYVPKGVYDAGVTYNRLDVVSYQGSSYVSLINNNIGNTPAEGANWSLVAQKGGKGDKGESIIGPTGETGESGFSPTIVANAGNTNDIYRLDITDKDGTTTTPNLKGQDGQNGVISVDAPTDGKTYGRKDEGWTEVVTETQYLDLSDVLSGETPPATVPDAIIDRIENAYNNKITVVKTDLNSPAVFPLRIEKNEDSEYRLYITWINLDHPSQDANNNIVSYAYYITVSLIDKSFRLYVSMFGLIMAGDGTKALMNDGTYKKIICPTNLTTVTSLTNLPTTNYSIKATLSAASPISFVSVPAEGEEFMIDILNSGSADFDQPLPNADNCQSNETSVTCPAGKVTAISVRYIHSKYVFRV